MKFPISNCMVYDVYWASIIGPVLLALYEELDSPQCLFNIEFKRYFPTLPYKSPI